MARVPPQLRLGASWRLAAGPLRPGGLEGPDNRGKVLSASQRGRYAGSAGEQESAGRLSDAFFGSGRFAELDLTPHLSADSLWRFHDSRSA
jgi:hypothetical protein